ncbi:mind the gap isoform X2 [Haematobia irritans]|uniref:mind the gap isoform X2 n=1 Tax=Haematobia irritans TaxID=7368 RepID=UPI003F4FBB18
MNFIVIGMLIMQAASFSLGDELGFPESLGNVEGGRRRSIGYKNGPPPTVGVLPANQQPSTQSFKDKRIMSRSPMVLSPELRESLQKQAKAAQAEMLHRQNVAATADNMAKQNARNEMLLQQKRQSEYLAQQAALREMAKQKPLMTEARPLPLGVPAFKPIPQQKPSNTQWQQQLAAERRSAISVDSPNSRMSVNNKLVDLYTQQLNANRTFHSHSPMIISKPMAVPAFQAMPSSVNRITAVLKTPAEASPAIANHPNYLQFEEPKFDMKDITVEELAKAANVSVDTIKHAIYVREQQLRAEHRAMLASKLREEFIRTSSSSTTTTTTSTTTTTTTPRPIPNFVEENSVALETKMSKVMNAPKEYYPVGYDKNFDDNFKSKVDLPPTTFSCAKQKHFPGLYADTDLGCMVFHVCALTDDGMVRKSFLCPENTLFDQTILKCNWWFYVDCSSSKSVYDSNIPISKSYQLMKSLTYFSKYSKTGENGETSSSSNGGLDIQNLKDSMDEEYRKTSTPSDVEATDDRYPPNYLQDEQQGS